MLKWIISAILIILLGVLAIFVIMKFALKNATLRAAAKFKTLFTKRSDTKASTQRKGTRVR